jgi:hypothetical protein
LRKFGVEIIDLCVSGWVINPSNVAEIKQRLEQIGVGSGTAVVTDLFGNSVFRFEDFDGSISKPTKVGGGDTTWRGRSTCAVPTSLRT